MPASKKSIGTLILVPIAGVILALTLGLAGLVHLATNNVIADYQSFAVETYGQRVRTVLDTAVAELRTANLLGNPVVEKAKKEQVLEALGLLWAERQLDGVVMDRAGAVVFTTLPAAAAGRYAALRAHGFFRDDGDGRVRYGTVTPFPPWEWRVVTLLKPATPVFSRREVRLLLPLVAAACVLMGAVIFLILRRNFHRPIGAILADITAGRRVRTTGVEEFDTVGTTVNDAIGRLEKKTEQYQLLHNLAVSVHEMLSVEDVLHVILGRAKELISAELAAIVLYDKRGSIVKLYALPTDIFRHISALPRGAGILEAVRLSQTPVRLDDLRGHPAFSGTLPPGHPEITNLLGCPILSQAGDPVGGLYFGNKTGGFTPEDQDILQAIAADAAIALAKAGSLTELRRFRAVVETSFNSILIADAAGTVRYANPAFEAMTGQPREEMTDKPLGFLGDGTLEEESLRHVRETALAGGIWKGEIAGRRKDGKPYSAAAVVFAIHTEEGVSIVSIQREQTQEKQLAEQLLRAQKMEAIGTLASGIAHDFNNILAGILGYAEVIQLQTREGEPFHKAALIIGQAAERGAELSRKLLMVARKERMELHAVDLNALVRDSAALLRGRLPANIELVLNLAEGLPTLMADPTQLDQVVTNLATNARDAMPRGGRLVIETAAALASELQTEQARSSGTDYLRLSVSDTGLGMDEDTKRRVYDPFFTTKGTGRGTGLGLFVLHTVVSNHGGYVNLYSEPGRGTRFSVYFPVTRGVAAGPAEPQVDLRGSATVLVIDDEYAIREMCKDLLRPLGYTVLAAADGEEGLRIYRETAAGIDVVILDMVMPKMGGPEVFEALRGIDPGVRVVLCSGYSQDGYAGIQTLIGQGAAGFVQKPFSLRAIGTAIKAALAG